MKCYTIIDSFGIDEYPEMWIANFSKKEDAQSCFNHLCMKYGIAYSFDNLINYGCGIKYYYGSESGVLFVRNEDVQEKFEPEEMP